MNPALGVVAGAGVGLGLLLIVRGLAPKPVRLTTVLTRLDRPGKSIQDLRGATTAAGPGRPALVSQFASSIAGRLGGRVEADLSVMERTADAFVIEKLSTSVALAGIAIALAVVLSAAGSGLSVGVVLVLVLGALAVGFVTPDLTLRSQADARRRGFRHALSSYLDLVNVLLAGGAGIETSLEAAAQAGDGWGFVQIRHALLRARTLRQSPFDCLTELGERIGVVELSEIAASVRLAGEQGARIKLSLAAKAAALRARQMSQIEADAQAATERMGLPTVLLFVGFIVLLGYPAMQQIVNGL